MNTKRVKDLMKIKSSSKVRWIRKIQELLLLVTILSQALFTLVRRNLVSFSFFTTRHNMFSFIG